MHITNVLIILLAIASAVSLVARRLRMPYTVALVVVGLALGFFHVVDAPHLTKDLLFAVFLPGLVFEAAYHLSWPEFRRNMLASTSLAVPGVALGVVVTAALLVFVTGLLPTETPFGWRQALVFGGAVAATDPVAVVALLRSLGAPERLKLVLESESLLNDGTGIVAFAIILSATAGAAMAWSAIVLQFVQIVGVGIVVGLAFGWGASQLTRHIHDAMVEITLTAIAAYGSFVIADQLGGSGVIATMAAGMVCGNFGAVTGMSLRTRMVVDSFWEYIAFLLNSIIFLLIGLEVHVRELLHAFPVIAGAFLAGLLARACVVGGVTAALSRTRERIPLAWTPALIWGGLRGGLSMVLILSLPSTFPAREDLIVVTFGVVIVSIIVYGLTMAPLLRLSRLSGASPVQDMETRGA